MRITEFLKLLKENKRIPNCLLFCPSVSAKKESYEPFLIEEAVNILIKKYIPEGEETIGVKTYYADDSTLEEIVEECKTLPFFTPQKVIIVRKFELYDKEFKKKDKNIAMLIDYLENPVDSTLLICIAQSIDPRKDLYKAFEKVKGVVEAPNLTTNEIKEWIQKKVADANKKISPSALEELIARTGTSLTEINNALNILLNYTANKNKIEMEDVLYSCADVAEESIWTLTDAIAMSDMGRAWEVLNDLLNQGKSAPEIIGIIHWLLENAYKTTSVSEDKPRSSYVENKVAPLAKRLGVKKLIQAMNLCNEVTAQMRQSGADERLALELLVLKLSHSPSHQQ